LTPCAAANSAIEGVALSAEDEALFEEFDRLGLSHEEGRKRLPDLIARDAAHIVAAE
jgi:hypothetical protein